MKTVQTSRGGQLKVPEPGERHPNSGKKAGVPTGKQLAIREAALKAAAMSCHSKTKDLLGYMIYLANERPDIFSHFLLRILPLELNAKVDNKEAVVYETVAQVREALLAKGMPRSQVDTLFSPVNATIEATYTRQDPDDAA